MLTVDIITLFPEMFSGLFTESILSRARDKGLVKINTHNLRNWAIDKRGTVDDRPYGGGRGMVLRPEPVFNAVEELKQSSLNAQDPKIVLLTPQGQTLTQAKAQELAQNEHLILICGHYEGFDERVRENLVDEEISIGDYVLTGGELPAMVITDTIVRLVPGVLPAGAKEEDSFVQPTLEYPQYTRPEDFRGHQIPKVLLSGNHGEIKKWRRRKSLSRTATRRPNLLTQQ